MVESVSAIDIDVFPQIEFQHIHFLAEHKYAFHWKVAGTQEGKERSTNKKKSFFCYGKVYCYDAY